MLVKGQKINDRYEIVKSIGEGGMANVYLANDIILNRKVAVKVLRGDLATDEKFIRRFQREAMSVSNLSHPNIVEVYDVGEEDGNYYIVMEYIEGKTLKKLIQKRGALTLPEVRDIMLQLTDGLAHAHDAFIIHRDIKPQNIMILDNGLVKITDFGIAVAMNATQLTQTNSVMGSVHYLPPEQANGKSATIKGDIYSLGILMFELLTGSVPFKGDNAVEIAIKHMKDKIPSVRKINPVIPQSVENIVLKATAKNPKNRYNDVREMYKDLETCLDRENEKRYVYPYSESDLEETKVLNDLQKEIKQVDNKEEKKRLIDDDDYVEVKEVPLKKQSKLNKIIIILSIIFASLLIIFGVIFIIVPKMTEVKDIKIPDVSGLSIDKAEEKLEKLGFIVEVETKKQNSDTINEGLVIGTSPSVGRTVKSGTSITLIESAGTNYYELEDFKGKNYKEVKAVLETVHEVYVLVERKEVDDVNKYKDKAEIIIEQSPEVGTKLVKGDTVTLYIPDIVEVYPDMVLENWSLADAEAFAEKYDITLNIEYTLTNDVAEGMIMYQYRPAGSTIIKGTTLKIKVSKAKDVDIPEDLAP